MTTLRRIADHPTTRVVLLILAGAQAMIGAFILGLAVNIGTSSVGAPGNTLTEEPAPAARGPFPLTTAGLVPGTFGAVGAVVTTADGSLWFADSSSPPGPGIGRVDAGGKVTSVPTRSLSGPSALTVGRDGVVWFADPGAAGIGFVTSSGAVGRYPIGSKGHPRGIAAGRDGNLWFTFDAEDGDWIGRMTPTGTVTRFALPAEAHDPGPIVAGADGNVWFSMANAIGRMTPGGEVTVVPMTTTLGVPAITAGPDKAIWFSSNSLTGGATVGRIETGRTPRITKVYDLPDGASLRAIVAGSDGNLWVTQQGRRSLARITPRGQVTEYTLGDDRHPETMAAGPDGRMWFTFLSPRGTGGVDRFDLPR